MDYIVAGHTDIGTSRKVNQDAYSIQIAETVHGKVVFVVLCDGVGGLNSGELASATVTQTFADWFEHDFSIESADPIDFGKIAGEWEELINRLNRGIMDYGISRQIRTGTTIALLLLAGGNALFSNVGDSRIYYGESRKTMQQISEDQTLAQREYANGRITKEQLKTDKRSHVLLQSVGSSARIRFSASTLEYSSGDVFGLCTDGFYRRFEEHEIAAMAYSKGTPSSQQILQNLRVMTEVVKKRKETDNITSVAVVVQ